MRGLLSDPNKTILSKRYRTMFLVNLDDTGSIIKIHGLNQLTLKRLDRIAQESLTE
jgi:hypothetical protein